MMAALRDETILIVSSEGPDYIKDYGLDNINGYTLILYNTNV